MNFAKDKYGPVSIKIDSKQDQILNKQEFTKDEDTSQLRGLFGHPNQINLTPDIVKSENKYISNFENIFLKPSATVFDENGHLKNLNEEFIRQELA